jgi:hypothetical protein
VSLKGFHVLLISLSSLLVLGFGGWSLSAWRAGGGTGQLVTALLCAVLALGLAVYVVWFARRIRTRAEEQRRRRNLIRPLGVCLATLALSTRLAGACSVCYGEAAGPMIDAARLGVYLLFGLVLSIQLAFVAFFLVLRKRAREAQPRSR